MRKCGKLPDFRKTMAFDLFCFLKKATEKHEFSIVPILLPFELYFRYIVGRLRMHSLAGQGIPLIILIDQAAAVEAILTDSKIRRGLYAAPGVNADRLKKDYHAGNQQQDYIRPALPGYRPEYCQCIWRRTEQRKAHCQDEGAQNSAGLRPGHAVCRQRQGRRAGWSALRIPQAYGRRYPGAG